MAADGAVGPGASQTGYAAFAGFVLWTGATTMIVMVLLLLTMPFFSDRHEEWSIEGAISVLPYALVGAAAALVPVLLVCLSLGYAVWRSVLTTGVGVALAATAIAALGSATLAAPIVLYFRSVYSQWGAGPNLATGLAGTMLVFFAVSAPVAVFIARRRYAGRT